MSLEGMFGKQGRVESGEAVDKLKKEIASFYKEFAAAIERGGADLSEMERFMSSHMRTYYRDGAASVSGSTTEKVREYFKNGFEGMRRTMEDNTERMGTPGSPEVAAAKKIVAERFNQFEQIAKRKGLL